MKQFVQQVFNLLPSLLSLLGSNKRKQVKEFSELVTNQFIFLSDRLEKALEDYLSLSDRVKVMHNEILLLREQLSESLADRCVHSRCPDRCQGHAED